MNPKTSNLPSVKQPPLVKCWFLVFSMVRAAVLTPSHSQSRSSWRHHANEGRTHLLEKLLTTLCRALGDSFCQFIRMNPLSWGLKGTYERTTLLPRGVLKSLTNYHRWNIMLEQKEVSRPQISPFRVFEERTVERCWEGGRDAPRLYSTVPTSQLWKQHSWACF